MAASISLPTHPTHNPNSHKHTHKHNPHTHTPHTCAWHSSILPSPVPPNERGNERACRAPLSLSLMLMSDVGLPAESTTVTLNGSPPDVRFRPVPSLAWIMKSIGRPHVPSSRSPGPKARHFKALVLTKYENLTCGPARLADDGRGSHKERLCRKIPASAGLVRTLCTVNPSPPTCTFTMTSPAPYFSNGGVSQVTSVSEIQDPLTVSCTRHTTIRKWERACVARRPGTPSHERLHAHSRPGNTGSGKMLTGWLRSLSQQKPQQQRGLQPDSSHRRIGS